MSELLTNPLEGLARAAETFRFEVPKSHRGLPGLGVTAAKNVFLRTLRPLHVETLKPQREFNLAALKVLAQISVGAVGPSDEGVYIRATLLPASDPGKWAIRSHRDSRVGSAISRAKSSYLRAMQPIVRQLIDQQRRFNELTVQALIELAAGTLKREAPLLNELATVADLFSEPSASPALRATRPLWKEVFRFQVAFNHELARALRWFASIRPAESLFFPTVTVIATDADAATLLDFLSSIGFQGYPAAFEAFVVTQSPEALARAQKKYAWVRGVHTLDQAMDLARGDLVVFTDAGRLLGSRFFEAHAREFLVNDRVDAVTAPLPAKITGQAWDALARVEGAGLGELIDPLTPSSFVNFGTGAFAVRRSRLAALRGANSTIEMGYRLYQVGARVTHAREAVSVAPEAVPAADPLTKLVTAHPEAGWVSRFARPRRQRRLRILTYRWHCAHQYELFKLPHDFTLMAARPQFSREWDFTTRPLRENAKFVPREALKLEEFDLAILPFDESCVNPSLANGVLASDWGELFRELRPALKIPMIALCHGTVPFHGQFDHKHERPNLVIEHNETERWRIADFVGDTPVVCNSHQAAAEWRFKNSQVIWHGFDPAEYPVTTRRRGAITVCPGISRRPHYCGYYLFQKATRGVDCAVLGLDVPGAVKAPEPPRTGIGGNDFAHHRFRNYVDLVREYSVFFNPTLLSPMPRSRAEAMLCGLAMVTTPNHDASMFVRDGVNGFCTSEPAEISERLRYLAKNPEAARKLGEAGRETAIKEFHIDRYLDQWRDLIAKVVG